MKSVNGLGPERMTNMILERALQLLCFCRHPNCTWPRRDADGAYRMCLECGRRLPWAEPQLVRADLTEREVAQ